MDWQDLLKGDEPWRYLWEIAFRTTVMFLFLLLMLKFLSKRGVKQLSVFELAILIALGSATGDPMFYDHVPVLHGIVVLTVVVLLYKLITWFTGKSKKVEELLEGKPVCLLRDGRILIDNYRRIGLPYDKFFAELRLKSIEHLGQVRVAYLETSGEYSIYKFEKNKIVPGLPIYPEMLEEPLEKIPETAEYACLHCGIVEKLSPGKRKCAHCHESGWLPAAKD